MKMDITAVPFNSHIGIERSKTDSLSLRLKFNEHIKNHLGTIHGGALHSLAEATSGEFLLQARGDRTEIGGVVRRASSKHLRPALDDVFSIVTTPVSAIETAISELDSRGMSLVDIDVELYNKGSEAIASFCFRWALAAEGTLGPIIASEQGVDPNA